MYNLVSRITIEQFQTNFINIIWVKKIQFTIFEL